MGYFYRSGSGLRVLTAYLVKKTAEIKTEDKPPLFSGKILKKITLYSIPSILQQSFISVGNIFVQYLVNSFGSSCIAGYSSAIKLNTFAITALQRFLTGFQALLHRITVQAGTIG